MIINEEFNFFKTKTCTDERVSKDFFQSDTKNRAWSTRTLYLIEFVNNQILKMYMLNVVGKIHSQFKPASKLFESEIFLKMDFTNNILEYLNVFSVFSPDHKMFMLLQPTPFSAK